MQVMLMTCQLFVLASSTNGADAPEYTPTVQLTAPDSKDQDDMCIWVHPDKRDQSTVIASDKSANRVFVYAMDGQVLQTLSVPKPGNIDLRQKVTLGNETFDIVVVNQRTDGFKLVIFRVNPKTRMLERIDDNCVTGPNYGGCLYHSLKTGRLYFVCTSDAGTVEQYELKAHSQNKVTATKVRTLSLGKCEGAVADDEAGSLFISEESKGVWKFDAEPDEPSTGTLIAPVGKNGLEGDVEGLAIFKSDPGLGYLLVSDQGRSRFMAFERKAPHQFVREFAVEGATHTDGIDVSSANLGPLFPQGLFACHTDQTPHQFLLTPWSPIGSGLSRNLTAK